MSNMVKTVILQQAYPESKPEQVSQVEINEDTYSDTCKHDIERINHLSELLELKLHISFKKHETGFYELLNDKTDVVLKCVWDVKNAWFYLEGVLVCLEQFEAKIHHCTRCGAEFTKDLKYCPQCRNKNWDRHDTRKYQIRKIRAKERKK